MKIALAQLNYIIGDFSGNTSKIIDAIYQAKSNGATLVVFSELAICGYPPRDFLELHEFVEACEKSMVEIASHCKEISAVIGAPTFNKVNDGNKLFNAAFFLSNGKVAETIFKTLLPTYDVFDESRYFEPNKDFKTIHLEGKRLAITICEDLWAVGKNVLTPMEVLKKQNPDYIINIAASPFSYNHLDRRSKQLQKNTSAYGIPLVYVNHVGAQTELIFDGNSMVIDGKSRIVARCNAFEEDLKLVNMDQLKGLSEIKIQQHKIEAIHDALVMGIRDYFNKLGFGKALVGLSGGIDSAVTFALAVEALGAKNVVGILMPSQYSSAHSVDDAKALAENLNTHYEVLPIKGIYEGFDRELKGVYKNLPFGLAEENLQARIRGTLLMAYSNKFGHILLNTSNKSEAAVGYGTLYGDMCGGLSVLGDVYKTDVFELAKYINREKEIIPLNTIIKPPSAELRPNQKDSDSLPEYEVLDQILYQYIEEQKSTQQIIDQGFDEALVKKVLRMVNRNEYKRFQSPPILRISDKAFGMGRRIPLVGKFLS